MGSRNALPMAPRTAFHPNGSAPPGVVTTPVAPPASAARMMAPRLPGSWMSAAPTSSAVACCMRSPVAAWRGRAASATMPVGVRTGLIASSTERLT